MNTMLKTVSKSLSFVMLYCILLNAHAQKSRAISIAGIKLKPFGLYVAGGVSGQLPTGSLVKQMNDEMEASVKNLGNNYAGNVYTAPIFTYVVAAGIVQPITEKINILSGLQFTQRGFHVKQNLYYSDPDYLRDDHIYSDIKTKVTLVEIPIIFSYAFSPKDRAEAGFHFGFAFKNTSKSSFKFGDKVYLNGELDEEWSTPGEKTEFSSKENISGFVPGFSLSYRRYLLSDLSIGAGLQYSPKYYKERQETIGSLCLLATLRYDFQF